MAAEGPRKGSKKVAGTRELAPTIEAARADIERERQLPPRSRRGHWQRRAYSRFGFQKRSVVRSSISLTTFRMIEELARADGSAAWCATVAAAASPCSAGYLQPEIAREIFGNGRTVVAGTINPTGKAFVVDGGYRVTSAAGLRGSGILHGAVDLG